MFRQAHECSQYYSKELQSVDNPNIHHMVNRLHNYRLLFFGHLQNLIKQKKLEIKSSQFASYSMSARKLGFFSFFFLLFEGFVLADIVYN